MVVISHKSPAKSGRGKRVRDNLSRGHRLDVYERIRSVLVTPAKGGFSRPSMLIRGPYGLHHSRFIARAVRTSCPHTLQKSLHSSVVRPKEKDGTDQNKVYAKSLRLPRTAFPQWTDPLKTEVLLRKKTCDDLYRWQVRFKLQYFPGIADIGS